MIETKASELNSYFRNRIAACEQRGRELSADERADEAVFEKVKANVYDAFRSVLSAGIKACKGDENAVRRFFADRLESIPSNWAVAYDKAKQHGDEARMHIEKIKLDAAGDISANFIRIWGNSND